MGVQVLCCEMDELILVVFFLFYDVYEFLIGDQINLQQQFYEVQNFGFCVVCKCIVDVWDELIYVVCVFLLFVVWCFVWVKVVKDMDICMFLVEVVELLSEQVVCYVDFCDLNLCCCLFCLNFKGIIQFWGLVKVEFEFIQMVEVLFGCDKVVEMVVIYVVYVEMMCV